MYSVDLMIVEIICVFVRSPCSKQFLNICKLPSSNNHNVQFQKTSILPSPTEMIRISWGWEFCKTKTFKEMYNFQRGQGGGGVFRGGRYGYFLALQNEY